MPTIHNTVNMLEHYQLYNWSESGKGYGSEFAITVFMAFLCIFLYLLGNLLPDIDKPESHISKNLHITIKTPHRGFTHSIWFIFPFLFSGYFFYPALYLAGGIIVHDLADAFSKGSICPLYPLGKHKLYCGTVMRPKSSKFGYYTGKWSETLFVVMLYAISALVIYMIVK